MEHKYQNAVFALVDIIGELKSELSWRDFQLEAKDKEITRLQMQLEEKEKER